MDLFFNITIMSLLLITIVYAWRLNNKLNIIRNHKVELKANIDAFYAATEVANKAVKDLQKQGKDLCVEIDQKVTKARLTSDEIDFMLTRARKTLLTMNEPQDQQKPHQVAPPVRPQPNFSNVQKPKTTLTREQIIEQRLTAANKDSGFMTLSEQDLLKAMRDREFKQALMG